MFFHLCEVLNSVLLNNGKLIYVITIVLYEMIVRQYGETNLKDKFFVDDSI